MVRERVFREDLYHRICTVEIPIPPLKERIEDIPLLINHYLTVSPKNRARKKISAEARGALAAMPWPGNVRQLFNVLDGMLCMADRPELTVEDIPQHLLHQSVSDRADDVESAPLGDFSDAMGRYERHWIERALREAHGNIVQASRLLNISRDALNYRMKRLGWGGERAMPTNKDSATLEDHGGLHVNQQTAPIVDPRVCERYPGPVLLLAGPGTGKTHQLAFRIKHLVETKGVQPEFITVITFTKEAAENMRRRISDEERKEVFIVAEKRPTRIMTMHSLGLEIIRASHEVLGLPADFEVATTSTLRRLLFSDAALIAGHGDAEATEADRVRQEGRTPQPGTAAHQIVLQYESILRANSTIDYDDQILLACQVLEKFPDIRNKYGSHAHHLLVDEYQDINSAQQAFIRLLSMNHAAGLFVVGDDDQASIAFVGGRQPTFDNSKSHFRASPKYAV